MSGFHLIEPGGAKAEVTYPAVVWGTEERKDDSQWGGEISGETHPQATLKHTDKDGTHVKVLVSVGGHIEKKGKEYADGLQITLNGALNMGFRDWYTFVEAVSEAVEKLTEAQNELLSGLMNKPQA